MVSASPSSTTCSAGRPRMTSTTSGIRSVMSLRLRVKIRTSSPRLWIWRRMPSSFHSTEASPRPPMAAATSGAVEASIGWTGRSTSSPTASRPARPSVRAMAAVWPRSPASMQARRTTAAGTSAALATASAMTPSSAPCRNPPVSRSAMKSISAGVARASSESMSCARAPTEPAPMVPASSVRARSRSVSVMPSLEVSPFSGRIVSPLGTIRPETRVAPMPDCPGGRRSALARWPSRRRSGLGGARRPGTRRPARPRRGRGGGGGRPGRRSWRCGPAWPPPALTPRRPRPGACRHCAQPRCPPSGRGP